MKHKFSPEDLFADSFDFSQTEIRTELALFGHRLGAPLGDSSVLPPPPSYTEGGDPTPPPNSSVGNSVSVTNGGMTFDLIFDPSTPSSFRLGVEQAASILSAAIPDHITVNLQIHYSGTGGGASAGPDTGQWESYSTVYSKLLQHATPGDTNFQALPNTTSIQGQSLVAVWNAQLKVFGLINPNDTTTDDGEATFATDINPNDLVGVALHELTHALGRVPYGPQPDIFDLFRFTSVSARLFEGGDTAPATYFSVDGGNSDLADFGLHSDPSDFLNPGPTFLGGPYSNLTLEDAFNEIYDGNTNQGLTTIDKVVLDALGFNAMPAPYSTSTFDAQGHLATLTSHTSDGMTFFTDYNLAHSNPWEEAVSTYDVHGSLFATTIRENDGTTFVTTYDPHGVHSWSQAISGYNTSGQIVYVTVEERDGTEDYTVYDQPGNNQNYWVYHYDVNHNLVNSYHHDLIA
jgi:hypothetical protein